MNKYLIKARRAQFLNDEHDFLGPRYFDKQEIHVTAKNQIEALELAAEEYGSAEVVKDGQYVENEDGVWTEMFIERIKINK